MNLIKTTCSIKVTGLTFIILTLLWLLAGCTGDQVLNPVTSTPEATLPPPTATPTPLPSPTSTPTATTSATATATPTARIGAEAQDYYYQGITYTAAGVFEEALDSFNQAITLQPDYALAYLERGKLYLMQKQLREAKSDFNFALELTHDPQVKAEVKTLLAQLAVLKTPVPTPVTRPATPVPSVTPIRVEGPETEAPLDHPFSLPLSQTVRLKEAGFTLTFLEVLEDSRCPKLVNCVWSGQVRLTFQIQPKQAEAEQFELNTNPAQKQDVVSFAGYTIRLIGVDPYPESPDQPIPPAAYQATLLVSAE